MTVDGGSCRTIRTALVTGATGFIGRALCSALTADGVSVLGVSRQPSVGPWRRLECVDLGVAGLPAALVDGVDTVFHLAARVHALDEARPAAARYQRDNVDATQVVVDAARAAGVARLVNFSSVKAMGEGDRHLATEADAPLPVTAYGRSKLAAEELVARAADRNFETVSLRLPMVYGPGGRGNLSRMMSAMAAGRFPPLPATGNRRSMVHLGNVVDAARLVAVHPGAPAGGGCYIVTDGVDYATSELQGHIYKVLGKRPPAWRVPYVCLAALAAAGDLGGRLLRRRIGFDSDALDKLLGSARYSPDKLIRELGFSPRHRLDDGLRQMWAALQRDVPPVGDRQNARQNASVPGRGSRGPDRSCGR